MRDNKTASVNQAVLFGLLRQLLVPLLDMLRYFMMPLFLLPFSYRLLPLL